MVEAATYRYNEDDPTTEAPTWGDYGRSVVAGAQQLDAAVDGLGRYFRQVMGDPAGEEYYAAGQQLSNIRADETIAGMSPGGRDRLQTEILSGKFLEHPISSLLLKAANMSPSIAASLLPLPLVSGVVAGTAAAGITAGAISAGQMIDQYDAAVDSLSDAALQEQSPIYKGMRTLYDEPEARRQFRIDSLGVKPLLLAVFGAATNAFGIAGQAARALAGGSAAVTGAGRGVLARTALGALESGGAEFLEEGASDVGAQAALVAGELQPAIDPYKSVAAGIEGAVMGMVMGAPLGAVSGSSTKKAPKPTRSAADVSLPEKGQGTGNLGPPPENVAVGDPKNPVSVGSATKYPKAEAAQKKSKSKEGKQKPLGEYPTVRDIAPELVPAIEGETGTNPARVAETVEAAVQANREMARRAGEQLALQSPQPSPQQVTPQVTGLASIGRGMAAGISDNLYELLWQKVQAGDATELGKPSRFLQAAIPLYQSGQIQSPEQLRAFAQTWAGSPQPDVPVQAPPAPVTPQPTPQVPGRVLEDLSPQAQEARAIDAQEDKVLAQQVNQEIVTQKKRELGPQPKHRSIEDKEKIKSDEKLGSEILAKHAPIEGETDEMTISRAKAIVDEATKAGVKIKKTNKKSVATPTTLILSEAQRLSAANPKKLGKKIMAERLASFRGREGGARAGGEKFEEALAERHTEAEDFNRREQGGVEAKADVRDTMVDKADNVIATKISKSDKLGVRGVDAPVEEAVVKTKAGAEKKIERAQAASGVRKVTVSEELKAKYAAQLAAAAKKGAEEPPKVEEKPKLAALKQKVEQKKAEVKQPEPKQPKLRPAIIAQDGNVYTGKPGGLHFDIIYPSHEKGPKSIGFVTPDGEFLNRDEAFAWVRKNEGNIPVDSLGPSLDALHYRQQAPKLVTPKVTKLPPVAQPTEAQKEAGNYNKGHLKIGGLDVTIETRRGQERSGIGKDGKKWSVKMPDHYGYIRRTEGADGDQVDVYLGPKAEAMSFDEYKKWLDRMPVFVVDQVDLDTRAFDEHKVMIGYDNADDAVRAYDKGFSDGRGVERMGSIKAMSFDEFKTWLKEGDTTKPVEETAPVVDRQRREEHATYEVVSNIPQHELETFGSDNRPVKVSSFGKTTVAKALNSIIIDSIGGPLKGHYGLIRSKLIEAAGDIEVHVIPHSEMRWLEGELVESEEFTAGFYNPVYHHIVLNERALHRKDFPETLLHEVVHAATSRAMLMGHRDDIAIYELMHELSFKHPELASEYGFANAREFVAEALSNPQFQQKLMEIIIRPDLARRLRLRGWRETRSTAWQVLVDAIRRMLGLPRSSTSALEAALRISERIIDTRLPEGAYQQWLDSTWTVKLDPVIRSIQENVLEQSADAVSNFLRRPDLQPQRAAPWLLAIRTLDQIAQVAENYFGGNQVRVIADTIERIRTGAQRRLEATAPLIGKLYALEKKYKGTGHWENFTDVAHDATIANVHPDVDLRHDKNKHLHFQQVEHLDSVWSRAQHGRLMAQWKKLPDDLKAAWHEAANYYRDTQNEMALGIIKNRILKALGIVDDKLAWRIHTGNTTDADKDLLTEDTLNAIKAAKELGQIKGVYFPLMRRGEWAVRGTYKIAPPANAVRQLAPNQWDFARREEAVAFAREQDTPTEIESKWVDPATGETHVMHEGKEVKLTPEDAATGSAVQRFRVTVQDRHLEFLETKKEALRASAAYEADTATFAHVEGTEPRQYEPQGLDADVTSAQMLTLMRVVQNKPGYRNLSERERTQVQLALREASIRFMGSTRIQSRRLPRRGVAGASRDFTRNAFDYAHSASAYLSRLEHAPVLEQAVKAMHEAVKNDASKNNTLGRRSISNEIDMRIDQPVFDEANGWHAWTKRLMTASYIDKLFSPAYSIINATQPAMVTAPVLAGRHGVVRSVTALRKAYSDIGMLGVVGQGLKDTVAKVRGRETGGFLDDVIARSARTDGERAMFKHLLEVGSISPDSGLEVADLIQAHKGAGGKLDVGLGYLEGIARQMPRAIEAINRTATALAAYRLEFARTHDQAMAVRYAQETVNNTQFLYSPTNRAPLFNHPLWKLALQFKQYGQGMYHLLGMNVGRAIAPASPEQRVEAIKTLGGLLATHVAMAGVLGLPTEPIKFFLLALKAFGISSLGWNDVEDQARQIAAALFGNTAGELVSKGLPRALGIDLSGRVGLDSLMSFGEPRGNKQEEVKTWIFDTVAGAPAALAGDWVKGMNHLMSGDFLQAGEKMIPIKFAADSIRAFRQATEGKKSATSLRETMTPYSPRETAVRVLGFTPAREAETSARQGAFYGKQKAAGAERQQLVSRWLTAKPAEKRDAWASIQKWNKGRPANEQIKMSDLEAAKKRRGTEEKKGAIVGGIRTTRRDRHLLENSPYQVQRFSGDREAEGKDVRIFNEYYPAPTKKVDYRGAYEQLPESTNIEDRRYMTEKINPFMSAADRFSTTKGFYMTEEERQFRRQINRNRVRELAIEQELLRKHTKKDEVPPLPRPRPK